MQQDLAAGWIRWIAAFNLKTNQVSL